MLVVRTRYASILDCIYVDSDLVQSITDATNAAADKANAEPGATSINAGNAGVGFFNTANVDSLLGEIATASDAITAAGGGGAAATATAGGAGAAITPAATAPAGKGGKFGGAKGKGAQRRYTPRRLWSA